MSQAVVLPVLIPMLAAILAMAVPRHPHIQRMIGTLGPALQFAVGLGLLWRVRDGTILVMEMGAWQAPFGIVFVIDVLAAIMVSLTGAVGLATAIYSGADVDGTGRHWTYFPLLNVLLMGVAGAFSTGDLFNLFVWFEVLLIASFVLLGLGGSRAQMEGSIKYVVLNLFSSALFLAALGLLYGLAGTVNMADLAVKLADTDRPGMVTTVAMLFLVVFGIKGAAFPLFFWLPSSYHTPASPVSALFAGLLTKVGVYALIRSFTLIFTQDTAYTHGLLMAVAVLTMLVGVLGALAQRNYRRTMSFMHISQVGYLLLGLSFLTPLALAGVVFYIVHHVFVMSNLFFLGGILQRIQGTSLVQRMGGLARSQPLLAIVFLIPALSLGGVPPLSGFWAKFVVVRAGLETESYVAVAAALIAGVLGLYAAARLWTEVFWKANPDDAPTGTPLGKAAAMQAVIPVVAMAAITLLLGFLPGPLMDLAQTAAGQLMGPEAYIEAVLGVQP
ncbi:MAG: proton-conducting transporter membrane subunit [Thermoplasmatota archaeon]